MADERVRRVLMTADTVGGVWPYALALASGLADAGVETTLVTMGDRARPEQRARAARIAGLRLVETEFKLEWMDDPWQDVAAAGRWLLDFAANVRPDVVHLNGYAHGALRWPAPTVLVAHSCVLSWWQAVKGEPAPSRYDAYRRAIRAGVQAASVVVAPSSSMLLAVRDHYGPVARGLVIPNGLTVPLPNALPKLPYVLTAGRLWDPAKNMAALAAAASRVSWPIHFAGSTRSGEGGTGPAADSPGLRMLGWLDEASLRRWMAAASIYALPARYEPFGLSALEAALHRTPLVLGDIASLREVWGDSAVFVNPDDDVALAEAIERLIGDAALRNRMADAATRRAETYSAERMVERYLDLYRGLASRSTAGVTSSPAAKGEAARRRSQAVRS